MAVSCNKSWVNLRCLGCSPLGEKLLWNRSRIIPRHVSMFWYLPSLLGIVSDEINSIGVSCAASNGWIYYCEMSYNIKATRFDDIIVISPRSLAGFTLISSQKTYTDRVENLIKLTISTVGCPSDEYKCLCFSDESMWDIPLQRCNNAHPGFSNYWRLVWLFNSVFRLTSRKAWNPASLALCEGNPLVTSGFPSQRASNA